MKPTTIILLAEAWACMLLSCSPMNIAGGGNSSGTGNGAIARASSDRIEGVTGPTSMVLLYSQDWLPLTDSGTYSDSSVADDSGKFAFANVPHGYYNLLIFTSGGKTSGIFRNIPCQPAISWADTIDTLKEPGFLRGFAVSKSDTLALSYVYVKGTPFHAMTDTYGEFLMGALPPSTYTLQIYGLFTTNAGGPVKMVPNITIEGTLVGGAIVDSTAITIYPGSIAQFTR
jgi:hypothetical protein